MNKQELTIDIFDIDGHRVLVVNGKVSSKEAALIVKTVNALQPGHPVSDPVIAVAHEIAAVKKAFYESRGDAA